MLRPRITPCLLVHQGGLVKTVRFAEPKYVGDPINAVKIFNEKEADELIVLDIDATVECREPDYTLIEHMALECRMPLCYGGGIRTAAQASKIIALGVEKVALSAAALEIPGLVRRIADEIGSQSVVVVLDVRRDPDGRYGVWSRNGRVDEKVDVGTAAAAAEAAGAGEIVVNSIDRDGVMEGYDLDLAELVRTATTLPITVLGGAGKLSDMGALVARCGIVGAAAGSLFVFKGIYRAVLISYPNPRLKQNVFEQAHGAASPPYS